MTKYIIRRVVEMLFVLFIISSATFFMVNAVPGNPILNKMEKFSDSVKQQMLAKYGYDKPLGQRYLMTMNGILHFDFGTSLTFPGQTMQSIIKAKLPVSARLGIQTLIFGTVIGVLLGILAAMNRGTWIDYIIIFTAILFISVPSFIFALGLQKTLGGKVFPIIGWPEGKDLWFGGWKYTVLPTISGAVGTIAGYTRTLKTSMLDIVNQDYVLTAKSKGLSTSRIVRKHIFRNSLIPFVAGFPAQVMFCIVGSFFIERVFAIPGLGMYYVEAVQNNDLPIVMGTTVIETAMFLVSVLLSDILYPIVDPRIRITGGKK